MQIYSLTDHKRGRSIAALFDGLETRAFSTALPQNSAAHAITLKKLFAFFPDQIDSFVGARVSFAAAS